MCHAVTLVSYNMHKGMSPLNRQVVFNQIAKQLGTLGADIWCLQEVQGRRDDCHTSQRPQRNEQSLQLGQLLSANHHYGKNAVYLHKDHGNAILSRFNLDWQANHDISTNVFERRGILHCRTQPTGWQTPLELLCVHLNLLHKDRIKQYQAISDYIHCHVHPDSPLILAGDFNDWQKKSTAMLSPLGLTEAFYALHGKLPATFPTKLPLFSLDRIYIKNLNLINALVHHDNRWTTLSDHLPLSITVRPPNHSKTQKTC